ncbi:MAG TPA: cytochrome P460 family protein [Candidatus Acidoferrales bacterium]|nr:cytochrome P460 family protein [Candidatus Acidoferrales bacterium]
MKNECVFALAVAILALSFFVGLTAVAQQDRNALRVPDGLAFGDFNGYDTWQDVAVSETQGSVKAVLGNPVMIAAYKDGIPDDGKPFPEGVKVVKIEWIKKRNALSPYFVEVPDTLKTLSFIEKDSKRFPKTHGWAYAQFEYDPASKTLKPSVTGSECGYTCHTKVASRDYIWTEYPPR